MTPSQVVPSPVDPTVVVDKIIGLVHVRAISVNDPKGTRHGWIMVTVESVPAVHREVPVKPKRFWVKSIKGVDGIIELAIQFHEIYELRQDSSVDKSFEELGIEDLNFG